MIRFWSTIKGLCYRKISLFCEKTMKKEKKKTKGSFFKEKCGSGGCTQISLISHNSGFTYRSQKRFSLFYSSSKAFSDDIST